MSTPTPPPTVTPPATALPLPAPITIKGKSYSVLGVVWHDAEGQKRLEASIYYPRAHKPLILWENTDYIANKEWTTTTALARITALAGPALDACF